MGIPQRNRRFLDKGLRKAGIELEGCRMLELGNQIMRGSALPHKGPAKVFFTGLGVFHTSVDKNGKDGSLILDLRKPINLGTFDVVTNFGTTEHVTDQWPVFSNIHNACRIGGLMVHVVPGGVHHGKPHGLWGYEEEFFKALVKKCGYKLLLLKTHSRGEKAKFMHETYCALQKVNETFITEEELMQLEGLTHYA